MAAARTPEGVTLVIPAFNEAPVIGDVVRRAHRAIVERLPDAQILVIDDGSTDTTADCVEALRGLRGVRCVRLEHNAGQGPAVYRGIEMTRSPWICQMDGDGQMNPADFWALWERREGADVVLGWRNLRRDPLHRLVLTRVVRVAVRVVSGRHIEDAAAPLRLIRRETWHDIRALVGDDAAALSILVSVAAVRRGWRLEEVPVRHRARPCGASRLRPLRLPGFVARGGYELIRLRRRLAAPRPAGRVSPLAGR